MSLDTKYRPNTYADVLGQDNTIEVCCEYVQSGQGFGQSYVFAGPHGGGKTTLARILARALLCDDPQGGSPCDQCFSCKAMLQDRSENFIEIDAATNSGKDSVKRITEEAKFGSFSGKRKIYLFDESHELSKQAFDVLLKPLEDNIRGTLEKQLVCIFCTTEPEKMRPAVLSRCAPVFRIRTNKPHEIAERLKFVCEQEGLDHDPEVLPLIAELCECHVRDSIKSLEGVSMLGRVDRTSVNQYLHLDTQDLFLELLETLRVDESRMWEVVKEMQEKLSLSTAYKRLAEICMLAYKLSILDTFPVPTYLDKDRLIALGNQHGAFLLSCAQKFAERPLHITAAVFSLDLAVLHRGMPVEQPSTVRSSPHPPLPTSQVRDVPASPTEPSSAVVESLPETCSEETSEPSKIAIKDSSNSPSLEDNSSGTSGIVKSTKPFLTTMGVHINPLAQNSAHNFPAPDASESLSISRSSFSASEFSKILELRVQELLEEQHGARRSGSHNLGSS